MDSADVPTRRLSFEDRLAAVPEHFAADGDLVMSHVVAVLSGVFPDGEDFFVRSVRRFRDQIDDPELLRQVNGFIGQEATHGNQHRLLNRRLAELGYPTKRLERLVRTGLRIRDRLLPDSANLAATAALEHFTATLAEKLLTDGAARAALGSTVVADIFVWHALEECEHKAVAFDVYRTVGGSERTRIVQMNIITVGFLVGMSIDVVASLLGDRRTYRRGELRTSLGRLRRSPFLDPALWRQLRSYVRPGFHPDDRDTTELVARWRGELFGPTGRLNDRVLGAA